MRKARSNKLNQQSITIFNYYISQLLPSLIPNFAPTSKNPHAQYIEIRNIAYHYVGDAAQTMHDLSQNRSVTAAKDLYFADLKTRTGESAGIKEVNCRLKMLPISAWVVDHVDIVVSTPQQVQEHQKEKSEGYSRLSSRSSRRYLFSSPSSSPEKIETSRHMGSVQEKFFELYVIHRSHVVEGLNVLEWLNFIERYKFVEEVEDEQRQTKVIYEAIFVYKIQGGLFSLNQTHRMLQNYFNSCCPTDKNGKSILLQKMISKIESFEQLEAKEIRQKQRRASFHTSHRRSLKFNEEQKQVMNNLLPKAEEYFMEINPDRKLNSSFLEQLVCRMMENSSYKEKESWQAIVYYLDFESRLRGKYSWSDFRDLREMKFFTYLGKDKMGRPVILNRVRFTLLSKISDKEKFFDFHFYLFEIYLQDQMEGWVDQFIVIGDASDQVSDNTDIMFTKRLLCELAKTTLGRCAHLFVSDVGLVGRLFIKIVFPILPECFKEKIHIFGEERQQILEQMREFIADDVIPAFLGGKNKRFDEQKDDRSIQSGGTMQDVAERNSHTITQD